MKKYLEEFHECMHVFQEFQATKANWEEVARASKELAESQAWQVMLEQYFMLTPSQRAKQAAADKDERQQLVHDILQQGMFNFPKLHLLTHYDLQIKDFGMLSQYFTKITEALHKPLKKAYKCSN